MIGGGGVEEGERKKEGGRERRRERERKGHKSFTMYNYCTMAHTHNKTKQCTCTHFSGLKVRHWSCVIAWVSICPRPWDHLLYTASLSREQAHWFAVWASLLSNITCSRERERDRNTKITSVEYLQIVNWMCTPDKSLALYIMHTIFQTPWLLHYWTSKPLHPDWLSRHVVKHFLIRTHHPPSWVQ